MHTLANYQKAEIVELYNHSSEKCMPSKQCLMLFSFKIFREPQNPSESGVTSVQAAVGEIVLVQLCVGDREGL